MAVQILQGLLQLTPCFLHSSPYIMYSMSHKPNLSILNLQPLILTSTLCVIYVSSQISISSYTQIYLHFSYRLLLNYYILFLHLYLTTYYSHFSLHLGIFIHFKSIWLSFSSSQHRRNFTPPNPLLPSPFPKFPIKIMLYHFLHSYWNSKVHLFLSLSSFIS